MVRGKHTFRFGADFLRQLARQHPPFNERGSFVYAASFRWDVPHLPISWTISEGRAAA